MLLNRLLRAGEGKMVKRLRRIADHINTLEDDVKDLSDGELQAKTDEFRKRHDNGESLDDLLPEAFAVAREAGKRVLGQRHFDVQLMGGAALHLGQVAEMKTGEGKTLTSVLPAYLNAISGKGVHLVTVNDYLAKRDAEWMGRIHQFLGLEVGVILSDMTPPDRRAAYNADITYGTNNEFGFDYLRDNMARSLDDCVQRGHNFAIVDEVDSILIDEARTPLIISGPADQSSRWYTEFARLAPLMRRDVEYEVDERKRAVGVTEKGVELIEDQLGISNLYEAANTPLVGYLNNALKAKELYRKDKEYIVRNGEVLIVDEFTGRILAGRRFNEGMHQAIEAKERVEIKAENQTLATITLQNFFRLYDKLAGMTGTAETEAAEFHQTYKLGVVPIPTNRDMVRADKSDLIYKSEAAKFEAVAEDIAERHENGQPVLVGTTSVEKSDYLSKLLRKANVPHEVLNAKHHEREASIISQAGQRGGVTIATNMAGRGTDIVLGGGDADLGGDPVHDQAHRVALREAEKSARAAAEKEAGPVAGQAAERFLDEVGSLLKHTLRAADDVAVQQAQARRAGSNAGVAPSYYENRDSRYKQVAEVAHKSIVETLTAHRIDRRITTEIADSASDAAGRTIKEVAESKDRGKKGTDDRESKLGSAVRDLVHDSVHEYLFNEAFGRLRDQLYDEGAYRKAYDAEYERAGASRKEVSELGGLYVIGTERHESRRIDNQLRGRSGRQGDPGESRFYLSLGDDLMRRFNAAMVERVMTTMRLPDDVPIEHKMVSRAIKSAQTQVEQQNMEIRKNVLKYDEVMNEQRKVIYAERRRVLEGEDLRDQVEHMIRDVVTAYVDGATAEGYAEDWDHEKLWTALKTLYPVGITWEEIAEEDDDLDGDRLREILLDDASKAYDKREAEIDAKVGEGMMRQLERSVMLEVLDRKWREHLYEMDYLKEGIGLRAMAQRDPLIEYQREGFDMFNAMLDSLREEAVGFLFNLQVERSEPQQQAQQPAASAVPTSNGQQAAASGKHAQPVPDQPAPERKDAVPSALRGKGLGGDAPRALTYSGPSEDGSVQSRGNGSGSDDDKQGGSAGAGGASRRERRAAARQEAKKNKKGARN
ncbi:preprotein translocase, SecA subunit [Prauserella marina]|uniref:Protein translocase subunit SecA n=2 Tax=Prauserella marina TaxID=530584 RepID=A0A1G6WZW2_9PSEU|nr:preprotein translocase subunit SecA [Prauserella marina]PWV73117.1 preprotein translocase SecA subunit [Prauserella marina]SDD71418.1 preprotein translocase, SecA subunit [Prauserella marina]